MHSAFSEDLSRWHSALRLEDLPRDVLIQEWDLLGWPNPLVDPPESARVMVNVWHVHSKHSVAARHLRKQTCFAGYVFVASEDTLKQTTIFEEDFSWPLLIALSLCRRP